MNNKLVMGFFMLFMVLGFASAFITTVQIKTLPSHDVYVTPIRDGSEYEALVQTMHFVSDGYGDVESTFEIEQSTFNLAILVKNGDERVIYEKFTDSYDSGSLVELTVAPEGAELIYRPDVSQEEVIESESEEEINETLVEEDVEVVNKTIGEIIEGNSGFFSGNVIVDFNKPFVKIAGYSLAGIIILLIIFIFIKRRKKKKAKLKSYGFKNKKEQEDDRDSLVKAERDLKKAQERVNNFKNDDKIIAAKKKLLEAERELLILRGIVPKEEISMKDKFKKELEKDGLDKKE